MALTTQQNEMTWAAFLLEQIVPGGAPVNLTKSDMRAAVTAIDNWISSNSASFSSALTAGAPAVASSLTAAQKTLLFIYVLIARQGLTKFLR